MYNIHPPIQDPEVIENVELAFNTRTERSILISTRMSTRMLMKMSMSMSMSMETKTVPTIQYEHTMTEDDEDSGALLVSLFLLCHVIRILSNCEMLGNANHQLP